MTSVLPPAPMRTLFLATLLALTLAPIASAQNGRAVKAWYHLRSGDRVETVQATSIEMTHGRDMTQLRIDGREMRLGAGVAVSFAGTGPEPEAYGGRSGSTSASGSGQHTEVEVIVDFEGNSTTRTTTTTTDQQTGSQTTTTTTTTTTSSGETTTTTTTTTK